MRHWLKGARRRRWSRLPNRLYQPVPADWGNRAGEMSSLHREFNYQVLRSTLEREERIENLRTAALELLEAHKGAMGMIELWMAQGLGIKQTRFSRDPLRGRGPGP